MGADGVKIFTSVIWLAAIVGIIGLVTSNPKSATGVMGAGATTISGVVSDLEGKPVKS